MKGGGAGDERGAGGEGVESGAGHTAADTGVQEAASTADAGAVAAAHSMESRINAAVAGDVRQGERRNGGDCVRE